MAAPPELVYPYTSADSNGDYCHVYGVATRAYRGVGRR